MYVGRVVVVRLSYLYIGKEDAVTLAILEKL